MPQYLNLCRINGEMSFIVDKLKQTRDIGVPEDMAPEEAKHIRFVVNDENARLGHLGILQPVAFAQQLTPMAGGCLACIQRKKDNHNKEVFPQLYPGGDGPYG